VSRRLQDVFWDLPLSSTEQLVAQRLAWHADDESGKCWPGIALICEKTGLKERAVQMAIKALNEAGHITREEARGLGVVYFVHPRTTCAPSGGENSGTAKGRKSSGPAPASDAPVEQPRTTCAPTPASDAPTPARRAPKQSRTLQTSSEATPPSRTPEPGPAQKRARQLPEDWEPEPFAPSSEVGRIVQVWQPGRLERELSKFRDYWRGTGKRMADWQATWRNWVRRADGERRDHGWGGRRSGGQFRDPLLGEYLDGRDP
jgi:hypothetical protein